MSRSIALFVPATLALAALTGAQNGPLVGYTTNVATDTSNLTRQVLCTMPSVLCPAIKPRGEAWAGGAAYDPRHRSIWHSQGTTILETYMAGCKLGCKLIAKRVLGDDSLVSGLTYDPRKKQLLQLETIKGKAAIVTYALGRDGCPTGRYTFCSFPLLSQHRAGAVTNDRKRDLLLVAMSNFDAVAPFNRLNVYKRQGLACKLQCSITLPPCSNGPLQAIRAMAFDECKDILYVSDGRQSTALRVNWGSGPCPGLAPQRCCPLNHPKRQLWSGFDIQPSPAIAIGKSCTSRPCPDCKQMSLTTNGDAVLGNLDFGFAIQNGPKNAIGIVVLRLGPCHSGVPFLCGKLHAFPPTFLLPAFVLNGVGACDGRGLAPLPLPEAFGLCGLRLCAQGVVLCPTSPIGGGVTNALAITLSP